MLAVHQNLMKSKVKMEFLYFKIKGMTKWPDDETNDKNKFKYSER